MTKIRYLLLIIYLCFVVLSIHAQGDSVRYLPDVCPDRIMFSFPGDPSQNLGVTWRTKMDITASIGEISKAKASPFFENTIKQVTGTNAPWEDQSTRAMGHKVHFSGLEPATKYICRVGDGTNWSEWMQFKTALDTVAPFSFLYFGDVQNNIKSLGSRTLRAAYAHQPDAAFMLFAGDLVSRSTEDYWREFFYAGGFIFNTIPSIPSPGNHEYYKFPDTPIRTFSRHWNQIFMNPENGPDSLKNKAYFIDYQGVRIISLDSYDFVGNRFFVNEQVSWLENTLQSNPNKWTIITFHHPVFSCSQGRNNERMQQEVKPVLEKYGVDLVLQGHDHTYCRGFHLDSLGENCPNPPLYVVSVAGPKMYGLGTLVEHDRVGSLSQFYQVININKDTLTFESYTVDGELYDSFQLIKTKKGENRFIEDNRISGIIQRTEIPEYYQQRYSEEEKEIYNNWYTED